MSEPVPGLGPDVDHARDLADGLVAEDPLHEQMCQLAHDIEDDDVAERLIHLAAQVRTLERESAEARDV
jgi:hypothetical protein